MSRIARKVLWVWFLISLVAGVVVRASAKQVTFDDLKNFKEAYNLQLSPDGKQLAYVVPEVNYYGGIWLVTTQTGSLPRRVATGMVPLWSPDGKLLSYYCNDRAGHLQLWVLDLASNHSKQVTHFARGIDPERMTYAAGWIWDAFRYSWSPDSKQLVFASRATIKNKNRVQGPAADPSVPVKSGTPLILTRETPSNWTLSGIFVHAATSGYDSIRRWKNGYPTTVKAVAGQPAEAKTSTPASSWSANSWPRTGTFTPR